MTTTRARQGVALLAAATFALAGCSAANTASSSAGAPAAQPAPAQAAQPQGPAADAGAPALQERGAAAGQSDPAAAPTTIDAQQKIIKSAAVFLRVAEVGPAAAAARGVAIGLGGQVLSESVNATAEAPAVTPGGSSGNSRTTGVPSLPRLGNYGQLTIAVPADKLDQAIDELAKLGTVVQRTSSSQDVTAQYVDTETRMKTKQASIDRVRALMGQAGNLAQIVELESQLSAREAELESLKAQLASMSQRVAMSTVALTITSNPQAAPSTEDGNPFVDGVKKGWTALLTSLGALLALIGTLLPWLILLGVPAWLALRVWLRRRAARPAPAPASYAGLREPQLVGVSGPAPAGAAASAAAPAAPAPAGSAPTGLPPEQPAPHPHQSSAEARPGPGSAT